jgi:large subunit ribosomal protein L18
MRNMKPSSVRKSRRLQRVRRHNRVRNKVEGSPVRPRLVVYRSNRHIEGQVVDDLAGRTIVGLSTLAAELRGFQAETAQRKTEHAFAAGKLLAERARAAGIEAVVFDRGGFKYHGRVKAFADGAREGGLTF